MINNIYLANRLSVIEDEILMVKGFSRSANENAIEASENAEKAHNRASEGSDYAYDASKNAFGNQCRRCP